MGLLMQTSVLFAGVVFISLLPNIFAKTKKYSQTLFLIGTGAMFGICFLELLPEVVERGGLLSVLIIAVVFAAYSFIHFFCHRCDSQQPFMVLFISLVVHCLASGVFLALSGDIFVEISHALFMAICVHKIYEALMFSFILFEMPFSMLRKIMFLSINAISLPAGVGLAMLFKESITERIALMVSNVAVGLLLSCLIFDFLIPSVRKIADRRIELAFIALGLLLTQLMLKGM